MNQAYRIEAGLKKKKRRDGGTHVQRNSGNQSYVLSWVPCFSIPMTRRMILDMHPLSMIFISTQACF